MADLDFVKLKDICFRLRLGKYCETFDSNGDSYYYKNASLIECQISHLFSTFLQKIGIKTVIYDYDDETCISYCKNFKRKNEKLIEFPIDFGDIDSNLANVYFAMKKDIERYDNYGELLKDLSEGYFIASAFQDLDKNIGYLIDDKDIIRLTPYYDLGSIFSPDNAEYSYTDYISDIAIDEKKMEKFCGENNYTEEYMAADFNRCLNNYLDIIKKRLSSNTNDLVFNDSISNVSKQIIDKIINFDIIEHIELDNHKYSNNSKKVVCAIFNMYLKNIIIKIQQNSYSTSISSNKKK